MDKYEYNLKLEEIDRLVDQGDYAEAASLADTVEWKRVRNVRTLCLISEIYEAADRLEDSKKILERAYRKSPVGKSVLYRLVEVTTALGKYDEALEYYSEYVQVAPHDSNRYILKYKLYKGRGSSTEELIPILEDYLGQEYTERWAYELAKLYREAGQMQKCLAACDDLVLWFHSGKYVLKALELKKKYTALTPKQQIIYEECMQEKAAAELEKEKAEEEEPEDNVMIRMESTDGEVIAEKIMAETEKEIAEEVSARKAELEQRAPEPAAVSGQTTRRIEGASGSAELAETKVIKEAARRGEAADSAELMQEENSVGQETRRIEREAEGESVAAAVKKGISAAVVQAQDPVNVLSEKGMAERLAQRGEAQSVPDSEEQGFDQEKLQTEFAKSMREIVSGVVRHPEPDEEDVPASVAAGPGEVHRSGYQETAQRRTANQLSIDDVLLSMGENGKSMQTDDGADAEEKVRPESQAAQEELKTPVQEEAEVSLEGEQPVHRTMTEMAAEELTDAQRKALQYTSNPEKLLRNRSSLPVYEDESAQAGSESRMASREELIEEARRELLAEKTIRIPTEEIQKRQGRKWFGKKQKEERQPVDTIAETAVQADNSALTGYEQDGYKASVEHEQNVRETLAEHEQDIRETSAEHEQDVREAAAEHEQDSYEAPTEPRQAGDETSAESRQDVRETSAEYGQDSGEPSAENDYEAFDGMPDGEEGALVQGLPDEQSEDGYDEEYYEEEEYLTIPEHLRNLFLGFTEIPELEEQIANAIIQAESKGGDRTSKTGNILIFGSNGSGKTTIATGVAKAVAQDQGSQVAKMAKIYAADLNKKDIAATVAKIAGGTLIIEEAGDLSDDTIDQLTTAMEFRTDGLIVILEDEQSYVHDLLMRHPRFTMKFTAQIYIPDYTLEELGRFAELYANTQDYRISEDGFEALYGKISALAEASGKGVSIGDVIDLVAKAIGRSNRFFRKMAMGKKRYDEQDYILLFAKDFK